MQFKGISSIKTGWDRKYRIVMKAREKRGLYYDEIEEKYGINPSEAYQLYWHIEPYEYQTPTN